MDEVLKWQNEKTALTKSELTSVLQNNFIVAFHIVIELERLKDTAQRISPNLRDIVVFTADDGSRTARLKLSGSGTFTLKHLEHDRDFKEIGQPIATTISNGDYSMILDDFQHYEISSDRVRKIREKFEKDS